VKHTAAKDFASEGQQRSLVLALRLAQAAWFQSKCGIRPVLLADDVLGELDPARRRRFWAAIDPESQVIATTTRTSLLCCPIFFCRPKCNGISPLGFKLELISE
jgi:recombinational DNA repair ATPase RecF